MKAFVSTRVIADRSEIIQQPCKPQPKMHRRFQWGKQTVSKHKANRETVSQSQEIMQFIFERGLLQKFRVTLLSNLRKLRTPQRLKNKLT